jgi:hypothetical protein
MKKSGGQNIFRDLLGVFRGFRRRNRALKRKSEP